MLHTNAEALSCWPVSPDSTHLQDSQTSMHMVCSVHSKLACLNQRPAYPLFYSDFDLQSYKNKDPDIGLMLTWLGQGEAQHLQVPGAALASHKKLWTECDCLSIINELLDRSKLISGGEASSGGDFLSCGL